jgi:hypothetical protein
MTLKSKTYTVAWDEVLDNVLDIDNQLKAANLDYLVFDVTSSPVERDGWVVADKVRYFGHFYNSLRDFVSSDADIFIFNAGDIYGSNQAELTKSVEESMSADEDIWIISPNITNECGPNQDPVPLTGIAKSKKYKDFVLTAHVNGIWVALRRALAKTIYDFYVWARGNGKMNFKTMTTGHGLDYLYCSWALYNNKKVYRNLSFEVTTGVVTSYSTANAKNELTTVIEGFISFVRKVGEDHETLRKTCEAIHDRLSKKRESYPIESIYLRLKNIEEFEY